MCGIAGYVGAAKPDLLQAMVGALAHRGPDDRGTVERAGVGLGMTRLAIIDLVTGRQPMTAGPRTIVFNGEIYNYRELRAELEAQGQRFATRSDTEVILRLHEMLGDGAVERLRGMFAFALWHEHERTLLLARDRLGKKPLYYWHRGGLFLFASEIKALLRHPAVAREVDAGALHHYLAFGYTPRARSIFLEVAKLPPGRTATLRDNTLITRAYWTLPAGAAETPPPSSAEAAARVREAVREAVRLRLESDVPVGIFLSGGVDSSAVVASAREVTTGPLTTLSVGFGRSEASFDERAYARLVAERYATEHHEEVLEPKVTDVLPAIVRAFDEPFADSSAIPTFVVSQAAARHVKVALSGLGGDEAFAGYPRYLGVRLSAGYARLPKLVRDAAGAAVRRLPDSEASRNLGGWARRFTTAADRPMPDRYLAWTRFFGEDDLAALATPDLRALWREDPTAAAREAYAERGHGDAVDGAFRIDLATYLPDDLLVMADRMAMAHSLELRAPFCDHRLLETSLALSPALKLPRLTLKGLLKRAYADALPAPVLAHRKQGFMIPLARWLRTELRPLMDDLLAPDRVRARRLFVPRAVERLRREHVEGRRLHADRLWTLMMAEAWMREYLDAHGTWSLG